MLRVCLMVALVGSLGCQGVKVETDAGTTACTKVGDSCTFAPGKLGVCVDGNVTGEGPPKLFCQSQH